MQIGDEVIWSAISAVVVGLTLKSGEYFMGRRTLASQAQAQKISDYQDLIEDELKNLREENRKLKAEADNYRRLYIELLDKRISDV